MDNSWYDDGDDDDGFDEEDEDTTTPCPFCGVETYDDAEWCPACRNYLSHEDHARPYAKPAWILIGVALALLPILYVNFAGVWTWLFHR